MIFIRNLEIKSLTVFCLVEVSLFCFNWHRRALVTPPSPPLDFLLLISVFPEPLLCELL